MSVRGGAFYKSSETQVITYFCIVSVQHERRSETSLPCNNGSLSMCCILFINQIGVSLPYCFSNR